MWRWRESNGSTISFWYKAPEKAHSTDLACKLRNKLWLIWIKCLLCTCLTIGWVCSSEVDLSDNRLGDDGARAMAGMLVKNSTLVSLNLSGNQLTDQAAEHLGPALISNTRLQRLDLSYNSLGERAGSTELPLRRTARLFSLSPHRTYFYELILKIYTDKYPPTRH